MGTLADTGIVAIAAHTQASCRAHPGAQARTRAGGGAGTAQAQGLQAAQGHRSAGRCKRVQAAHGVGAQGRHVAGVGVGAGATEIVSKSLISGPL